ncbi:ParE family toxin-like protein [Ferruginibacter sp.]|nr:hypothetical protein [Ferruginibacter sp.]
MKHFTVPSFWECYDKLPAEIKEHADKNYSLLKENPNHPSLHFKKIEKYYSVRVSLRYRALGIEAEEGIVWFWIGSHAEYDKLLS